MKNRKGFIGLTLITISLLIVIIASTALFSFFYLFFKIGLDAEGMSRDYEYLSSGIYYGIWLLRNPGKFGSIEINKVNVGVSVNPQDASTSYSTITAGPLNNRKITCKYTNVITSWE